VSRNGGDPTSSSELNRASDPLTTLLDRRPAAPAIPTTPPPVPSRRVNARRRTAWLLGLVVLTVVTAYLYHDKTTLLTALAARGRHATATVTSVNRQYRRRGGVSYSLRYQYVLPGGTFTGSKPVSADQARRHRAGDAVEVIYDPASPGRHINTTLEQARRNQTISKYVMAPALAGMWGVTLWVLARRRGAK
jgi:hypothetical protein